MLEKVLIPVDFTEQSAMMIDAALELKDVGTRSITILHVAPKGKALSSDENAKLADMLIKLKASGLDANLHIRNGDPVETIVDESNKGKVDIIAMASGGKSRREALFVGSVSFGVIKRSSKPILLDKFPESTGKAARAARMGSHLFRHALVTVDIPMSSNNLEVLFDTLCMKGLREATLFHVIESAKYSVSDNRRFAEVKLGLEAMRKKTRGGVCDVRTHIHFGTATYNILEVIKEVDASMVIIGTSRLSYLRGALGTTAEDVIRKSPIPVLVVPS